MNAPADHAGLLSQQLEQLRAKKAAITTPLDDEIQMLTQKLDALKPTVNQSDASKETEPEAVASDVVAALVAACASDNLNAFARAGRLVFKANAKLSSVRSDRRLSLLHTSARFGSVKTVQQLLDADPTTLNILDDLGRDALTMSVLYRQLHVFHILARLKDSSFAHQSLPFLNNSLHFIARSGLISFAREILNTTRGQEARVEVAMLQYNKDGLLPIHIMAARLDIEMIKQAHSVQPQWLDACTATGTSVIDIAITGEHGLMSPRDCFAFVCEITRLHSPAEEQFLLAASNRYKHTGALARCDGALLAYVTPPPPPPPPPPLLLPPPPPLPSLPLALRCLLCTL
jgi:hypothetical protein